MVIEPVKTDSGEALAFAHRAARESVEEVLRERCRPRSDG